MRFMRGFRPTVSATHPAASGQTTAAHQLSTMQAWSGGRTRSATGPRRRRPAKAPRIARSSKRRAASTRKPARLVKGSAAAKRYMASIRRKRR